MLLPSAPMKYRMIGIDLDGTLLNKQGIISPRNLKAIETAVASGVLIVPCTGRSWIEAKRVLEPIKHIVPLGVFVGGAVVTQLENGHSLDLACFEPHLALQITRHLFDGPEAVLIFRDANLAGHDYLITGKGKLSSNTRWWFENTQARVMTKTDVTLDDMHHAMRLGIVATVPRMKVVTQSLLERFDDNSVLMQSFQAVQMPNPAESVHVLEIFANGTDKWRGLHWVAREHGIEDNQVACIGDEINDVAMIRSAGCGIAMGNAIPEVRNLARHITLDNIHDGVAHAIEQLMAENWR